MCPEEGNQNGEKSQGQDLLGAAEVTWFIQLGEGRGVTSSQSTTSLRGVEAEMLISSFWWPVIGQGEMERSCIRGSSDWTLGKGSSLRESSVTGTESPGKWSQHLSEFKEHLDAALSHMV